MVVKIVPNDKANPPGKLADAELHFTDGVLDGLKLIGFAIWERRSHVFAGQNVGVTQVGERIWLSPSCSTISATSTTKPVGSSRSQIRLRRKCYRCRQNKVLPIRPEWT